MNCGYALEGLPDTGNCPECGTPVAQSRRGTTLRYSSPGFVAKLHRGVFLVLAAIIVQILVGVAGILIGFAAGMTGGGLGGLLFVLQLLGLGVSLAFLYGWWLLSEKDPRYTGGDDGSQARTVVRATVAIYAVFTLGSFVVQVVDPTLATSGGIIGIVLGFGSLIVWAVQYFASMQYTRWLAARIPNPKVQKRAKLLLWLGPLLSTVGIVLIGLGPLIALVLYWNMFDQVRKDFKAIRAEQTREGGAAVA